MSQPSQIPDRSETIASLLIVLILAGIATAVCLAQFRDNPALLPISIIPADAMPENPDSGTVVRIPDHMMPLSGPEAFNRENLSEKINGKAELYLAAGFVNLKCQRFTEKTSQGKRSSDWMEVFIYEMGDPDHAFSVFSAQRREDSEPLNLTQFAYRTANAVFFVHGTCYIEIMSSIASEKSLALMESLARQYIQSIQTEPPTPAATEWFPKEHLLENRITLISADGFGYEEFDRIYTAVYTIGNSEVTAFFSLRQSPEEAAKLASGYHAFLVKFGGKDTASELRLDHMGLIHILDTYELVFTQGRFVAGVREARTKETAEYLAKQLNTRLADAPGSHP